MWTSENNWYSWAYDDQLPFSRQTEQHTSFRTIFKKYSGPVRSFKEELMYSACSTIEHAADKIVVLFSGGADSELMLRAFLAVGYTPEVVIIRYENDYNIYDVSYAVTICSMLNVDYKILDFNLHKFYENEAERISELAQIDRPRALPQCRVMELVDGFPVMGTGDLNGMRLSSDYSKKHEWIIRCYGYEVGASKFLRAINKPGVAEWFKWTPGVVLSYMNLNWFKKIINDEYYGKEGFNSTKLIGYREAYPDMINRKKQTGFEKVTPLIEEFEMFLQNKNNGLIYRKNYDRTVLQLLNEIRSNP